MIAPVGALRVSPSAPPPVVAVPSQLESPTAVIATGMWFGLAAGFAESVAQVAGKLVLDRTVHLDLNATWMLPLLYMSLFTLVALALLFLGRRWPRLLCTRVVVGVPAFLALATGLLMLERIHGVALLLLAAGLAVQGGRLVESRMLNGFRRLVRGTLGWMAAVMLVLAMAIPTSRLLAERRALAALPDAAGNAPSVLLIIWDTARAASMSLYGYERPTTPNLARFAAQGARFDRAISTAPWTLPTHVSLLTGRYPHETSAAWKTALDDTYPTLAQVLATRGYRTGGFVANRLYTVREFGLARGFARYDDYAISPGQFLDNSTLVRVGTRRYNRLLGTYHLPGRKVAPTISDELLSWLDRTGARPFFAFLNYFDAHEPYVAELPGRTFRPDEPVTRRPQLDEARERFTREELQSLQDAYDATLVYLDHHLALLLDSLEQRGLLRNTIVILTSDHGEEFGEHGHVSHGNSLYLPSLHVPLVIVHPSLVPAGTVVAEPVTLRDVPATVLDLLGPGAGEALPGRSLAHYWTTGAVAPDAGTASLGGSPVISEVPFAANQPEWYPVSRGDMSSLIAGRHHLIRAGDGTEELYDVFADPFEVRDLAPSPGSGALLSSMRASLFRALLTAP